MFKGSDNHMNNQPQSNLIESRNSISPSSIPDALLTVMRHKIIAELGVPKSLLRPKGDK
jgi:hypothetical protein